VINLPEVHYKFNEQLVIISGHNCQFSAAFEVTTFFAGFSGYRR